MVARVVAHDKLRDETDALVQRILRCDQAAIESAKETVLEIIGRPLYDQLRVEAMWGYALCGRQHHRDGAITTVLRQSRSRPSRRDSHAPITLRHAPITLRSYPPWWRVGA
jgi:enoyl-CoA hydratase/carnithine racemase